MACLNMQVNNEKAMQLQGPRISFSNDFVESNTTTNYTEAPVSSDFEFSVPTFSSNSADQVFFKGKQQLIKEKVQVVTLRDELLADDDDDIFLPSKNFNSTGWWREKFGRRKTQPKTHKNLGGLETIDEAKIKPTFYNSNFTGSHQYK